MGEKGRTRAVYESIRKTPTGSKPPKLASFYLMEFSGLIHKRPGYGLSPSGRRPFLAVSRDAFWPGDPRNGPKSWFRSSNPAIIWEKGGLGAPGLAGPSLLLGES